jgi:hypothetical protein
MEQSRQQEVRVYSKTGGGEPRSTCAKGSNDMGERVVFVGQERGNRTS